MITKDHTPQTLFAKNTKNLIKDHVKGSVTSYINDDALTVYIYGVNEIVFKHIAPNISQAILQGYTSEMLAHVIVKRYTSYIRNLFFL